MTLSSPASSAATSSGQAFAPLGAGAARSTIAVIGDLWTLRILRTVFRGKRRHGDFVKEFGVSRAVLSDRLEKLLAHGVLERHVQEGRHPEYRLTDSGLDLWSLYLAMWLWETDWGTARDPDTWAPDLPRAQVLHTGCNHVMRPQLRCQHCQQEVLPFDTRPEDPQALAARHAEGPQGVEGVAAAAPAMGQGVPDSGFRRARQPGGRSDAPGANQRLVRVIGDRWNSAIVAAAFRGVRLFSQFEQDLQIGPSQLSDRLAELQQLDILRTRAYAGARQEYRLTKAGIALFPTTLELVRWGSRWLWGQQGALHIHHVPCGHALEARWHCGHCQAVLERESLRFS